MKIFDWMQSRLNANQKANKTISRSPTYILKHESCKEEFSDWPNGLLAIGTFGNDTIKHSEKSNKLFEENVSSFQDHHQEEITPEEVKELQKELKFLLQNKESSLNPPEKFFDCLQILEDDRNNTNNNNDNNAAAAAAYDDELLLVSNNSSSKDVHIQGSKGNNISKKSLAYLLRRTFFSSGPPKLSTPMLRDPIPEIKLEKSRFEKILRALLKKKIYPQNPTTNSKAPTKKFLDKISSQSSYPDNPARKCLDNKYESETDSDDEAMDNKFGEGCKWVKTDSEFIVLEI